MNLSSLLLDLLHNLSWFLLLLLYRFFLILPLFFLFLVHWLLKVLLFILLFFSICNLGCLLFWYLHFLSLLFTLHLFTHFFTWLYWWHWTLFCVYLLLLMLGSHFLNNFFFFGRDVFLWFEFRKNIFFCLFMNGFFRLLWFRMLLRTVFLGVEFRKFWNQWLFIDSIEDLSGRCSFVKRRGQLNVHQFLFDVSSLLWIHELGGWGRFWALRNDEH